MNYFSDDLIKHITEKYENHEERIDELYDHVEELINYYSYRTISPAYVAQLLARRKITKFAFYCMDNTSFNTMSCPSCLIYHRFVNRETNAIEYYILMVCTKPRFKSLGYASMLLNGFIERVKRENADTGQEIKIIVSSLDTAVSYYEHYGFTLTGKTMLEYPRLLLFEKYDETKENFIMEMNIR